MTSQKMLNETADQNLIFYLNRWNAARPLGPFSLLDVVIDIAN